MQSVFCQLIEFQSNHTKQHVECHKDQLEQNSFNNFTTCLKRLHCISSCLFYVYRLIYVCKYMMYESYSAYSMLLFSDSPVCVKKHLLITRRCEFISTYSCFDMWRKCSCCGNYFAGMIIFRHQGADSSHIQNSTGLDQSQVWGGGEREEHPHMSGFWRLAKLSGRQKMYPVN